LDDPPVVAVCGNCKFSIQETSILLNDEKHVGGIQLAQDRTKMLSFLEKDNQDGNA
jgi:hypothetical protein